MKPTLDIVQEILEFLATKGLNQRAVAREMGKNPSVISRWYKKTYKKISADDFRQLLEIRNRYV